MWTKVCSVLELTEDEVFAYDVLGEAVAVYNLEGKYYATEGLCTHEKAELVKGYLSDGIIECPKHNARFEVATGKCLRRPAKQDLKTYPVKVEGNDLYVDWNET